ncbi:MAG: cytidine deaminase [SAR324 cluster bacterium]|nr:cytidine deaminase [SAR324 cluster bacterium]
MGEAILDYQALQEWQQKLLDAAETVLIQAYNPYSRFSVGAALLTETGEVIGGANFENAAYSPGICAERAALVRANAQGYRKFKAVAVMGRPRDFQEKNREETFAQVTAPCGVCRQMLFEADQLSDHDLEVIMSTPDKSRIVLMSIKALLPYGFGPQNLGIDLSEFKK